MEDRADNKQFSRISLKEQISQMIQELEEPAKKEPKELFFEPSPIEVPEKEKVFYKEKDSYFDSFENRENDPYVETEIQEQKTLHELEIENLKLENCALRQKLRTIQENSAFIGIFNIYEDEIRKLEQQMKTLREEFIQNINIIERTIEISNSTDDEIGILNQKHKQSLKSLSNHIKTLESRITEKEKESSELKKNERK